MSYQLSDAGTALSLRAGSLVLLLLAALTWAIPGSAGSQGQVTAASLPPGIVVYFSQGGTIYRLDPGSAQPQEISTPHPVDVRFFVRPVNGTIVYQFLHQGRNAIGTVYPNGSTRELLPPAGHHLDIGHWSPTRPEFIIARRTPTNVVFQRVSADLSQVNDIITFPLQGFSNYAGWSPDGNHLLFRRSTTAFDDRDVIVASRLGGTSISFRDPVTAPELIDPHWLDSDTITFIRWPDLGEPLVLEHIVASRDGSTWESVFQADTTSFSGSVGAVSPSSSGSTFAYNLSPLGQAPFRIFLLDVPNTQPTALDPSGAGDTQHLPWWSPDDSALAYTTSNSGDIALKVFDFTSDEVLTVHPPGNHGFYAGVFIGPRVLFYARGTVNAQEFRVYDVDTRQSSIVYTSNVHIPWILVEQGGGFSSVVAGLAKQ